MMPRTLEQRQEALAKANRVRLGRAAVKAVVKDGSLTIADALAHPDVQSETAANVLGWVNGAGRARVRKWLRAVPCSEFAQVGQLTDRQRRMAAYLVDGGRVSATCSRCGEQLREPDDLCGFCKEAT